MVKVWNPVTDVYDDLPGDPFAVDSAVVHDTGDETIAGVKTFTSDPLIPDEVYGAGWNGSLEPPTKNAVYDKIETIGGGSVDDTAYDATTWNGVTATAPSKNAVRDKVELLAPLASPTFTGNVVVPDADAATEAMNRQTSDARYIQQSSWTAYTPSWTASTTNPTIGDGVLAARYKLIDDDTILWKLRLEIGSTTTFGSGNWEFSLPAGFTTADVATDVFDIVSGVIFDNSAGNRFQVTAAVFNASTQVIRFAVGTSAADFTTLTPTAPMTWASGDQLYIGGAIEGAFA